MCGITSSLSTSPFLPVGAMPTEAFCFGSGLKVGYWSAAICSQAAVCVYMPETMPTRSANVNPAAIAQVTSSPSITILSKNGWSPLKGGSFFLRNLGLSFPDAGKSPSSPGVTPKMHAQRCLPVLIAASHPVSAACLLIPDLPPGGGQWGMAVGAFVAYA